MLSAFIYLNPRTRNALTRCIGQPSAPEADLLIRLLKDGDRLLLCSDGITRFIEEKVLARMLIEAANPASGLKARTPAGNTRGYVCSVNWHIPACQQRTEFCPIASVDTNCYSTAFCDTGAFVCGRTLGCTVGRECSVGC